MAGLRTGPNATWLGKLFIPSSILLVSFTGYSSQWLLNTSPNLSPGPLTTTQTTILNTLIVCVWRTYYKACTVSPGRYKFPITSTAATTTTTTTPSSAETTKTSYTSRFCKKCVQPKPLRAHHCRHCRTCIPKMDHHCPWTSNCVSLQTFPHFLRFLTYSNLSLWYMLSLLLPRFLYLWEMRNLPAYLGPGTWRIVHLIVLALVGSGTALAMGILWGTTVKGWVFNVSMIEDWEVERHEAVLERARRAGEWWDPDEHDSGGENDDEDDDGQEGDATGRRRRRSSKGVPGRVEFPYDIGIFANMAQAMGTKNIFLWFLPFAGSPRVSSTPGKGLGWEWEENEFNPHRGMWPPLDPEKARRERQARRWPGATTRTIEAEIAAQPPPHGEDDVQDLKAAFRKRQEMDLLRRQQTRKQAFGDMNDHDSSDSGAGSSGSDSDTDADEEEDVVDIFDMGMDGEPGWTNSDGDRLRDYGVDEEDVGVTEDLNGYEDEDVPISEILRRRKNASHPPG